MTDLFQTHNQEAEQQLGQLLQKAAHQEALTIARQGRIAPWIELDQLLSKDDLRFLTLIEEHAGYVVPNETYLVEYGTDNTGLFPTAITRRVDHMTYVLGFMSPANCAACINRSLDRGWVVSSTCQLTGLLRYDIAEMGRYVLELKESDMWFEEER